MWFRKRNRRQPRKAQAREPLITRALSPLMRARLLWVGGATAAVVVVGWSVLALFDRPVSHVEVTGQFLRVSALQVEQAVSNFTKLPSNAGEGFISLDLDKLRAAVEAIDWVDHARIERHWPDTLRVTITEQIPGARWGDHGLLNSRGELFLKDARYMPPELPQLDGPDGTEPQVARLYLDTYPRLAGVGLRLARVTLDARGAWELAVTSAQSTAANNSGVVVRLGRQDVQDRLNRFIAAASPLIAARPGEIAYVDMRYSNGFAVGWTELAGKLALKSKGSSPDA